MGSVVAATPGIPPSTQRRLVGSAGTGTAVGVGEGDGASVADAVEGGLVGVFGDGDLGAAAHARSGVTSNAAKVRPVTRRITPGRLVPFVLDRVIDCPLVRPGDCGRPRGV